VQTETEKTKDF